jgi:hypothetical protein
MDIQPPSGPAIRHTPEPSGGAAGGGGGGDGSRTIRKKQPLSEIGRWRPQTAGSGGLGTRRDMDLVSEAGELAEEVAGFGLFAPNEQRPTDKTEK